MLRRFVRSCSWIISLSHSTFEVVFVWWSNCLSRSDDPEVFLSIGYPVAHQHEGRHHLKKRKMQIWTSRLSFIGRWWSDCDHPATNLFESVHEVPKKKPVPEILRRSICQWFARQGSSVDQILIMSEQKYWWYLSPARNQLLKQSIELWWTIQQIMFNC